MPAEPAEYTCYCEVCGKEVGKLQGEFFGWIICSQCAVENEEVRKIVEQRGRIPDMQIYSELALFLATLKTKKEQTEASQA
jgi:hypothetical protein